jgi:hypothetical protein
VSRSAARAARGRSGVGPDEGAGGRQPPFELARLGATGAEPQPDAGQRDHVTLVQLAGVAHRHPVDRGAGRRAEVLQPDGVAVPAQPGVAPADGRVVEAYVARLATAEQQGAVSDVDPAAEFVRRRQHDQVRMGHGPSLTEQSR